VYLLAYLAELYFQLKKPDVVAQYLDRAFEEARKEPSRYLRVSSWMRLAQASRAVGNLEKSNSAVESASWIECLGSVREWRQQSEQITHIARESWLNGNREWAFKMIGCALRFVEKNGGITSCDSVYVLCKCASVLVAIGKKTMARSVLAKALRAPEVAGDISSLLYIAQAWALMGHARRALTILLGPNVWGADGCSSMKAIIFPDVARMCREQGDSKGADMLLLAAAEEAGFITDLPFQSLMLANMAVTSLKNSDTPENRP
jgi:hypothetical protein